MTKILAIDLGKFKSVTCLLETETNETEFWTLTTDRPYLEAVLKNYEPDLVVIEACGLAELFVTTFWTFLRELSTAYLASSGDSVTNG